MGAQNLLDPIGSDNDDETPHFVDAQEIRPSKDVANSDSDSESDDDLIETADTSISTKRKAQNAIFAN